MPEKFTEKPFRKRILRTYLFISAHFITSLAIVLLAMFGISDKTRYHLSQVSPLVETVNTLSEGVNKSILLLQEWFLTMDPAIQQKRAAIWDNTIYPAAEKLSTLPGNGRYNETKLHGMLQGLQTEQWIAGDLVHMQGNEYANNIYKHRIVLIEKRIINVTTEFMTSISSRRHGHQIAEHDMQLLASAANVKAFFSYSCSDLVRFIFTGDPASEKNFRGNTETVKDNLTLLLQSQHLTENQTELIGTLKKMFSNFEHVAGNVITVRRSTRWNQAVVNYNNVIIPLYNELNKELNILLKNKTDMLRDSSEQLTQSVYNIIIIFSLIGMTSGLLIVIRARRDTLFAAKLEATILRRTEQLATLSRIDQLTGLYNRRAMEEQLNKEFSSSKRSVNPLTLVYFDIDDFKVVNDSKGHAAGDEVLRDVGASLKKVIREMDTPCRQGGDEFCIILPNCTSNDARKICERLIKEFSAKHPDIYLSIGIAELDPSVDVTPEQLTIIADDRMYLAKKEKGHQIRS